MGFLQSTLQTRKVEDARWPLLLLVLGGGAAGGGAAALAAWFFAGRELYLLLGLLALGPLLYAAVVRFDNLVFLAFVFFGVVVIEPAPTDLLIMLLLPVGVLAGRLPLRLLRDNHQAIYYGLLGGFLVVNLASAVGMDGVLSGVRFLAVTAYLIAFAFFVRMYVRDETAVRTLMGGYIVSGIISMALVALGFMGVGGELFVRFGLRAQGLFQDTNVFGPYLILPLMLLVDEMRRPQLFHWSGGTKLVMIAIFGAGVFLSGSRAAWGNLVVALLVYSGISGFAAVRRHRLLRITTSSFRRLLLAVLLLVGLLLLVVSNPDVMGFLTRFVTERARFQTYDADRFANQREGLMVGLTHLVGLGPGSWSNAHSLYARTLAEHGIFALFFLLSFFLIISTRLLRKGLDGDPKRFGLSAAVLLGVMTGHLLNSFVIDTIHWRHFWLILALAWAAADPEPAGGEPGAVMGGEGGG